MSCTSYRLSGKCLGPPEATNHVGYNELPVNVEKGIYKSESKRGRMKLRAIGWCQDPSGHDAKTVLYLNIEKLSRLKIHNLHNDRNNSS